MPWWSGWPALPLLRSVSCLRTTSRSSQPTRHARWPQPPSAVDWLTPYRPEIKLVHAVEFEVPTPYLMAGVDSVFQLDSQLSERLGGKLRERASGTVPADWVLTTEIREGRPHREVPRYAAEVEADLLVVAGESHRDLDERILGGTVERIARHAPCPMLVV